MFANLILSPFIISALVILYLSWVSDGDYAIWMVPFLVVAAIIFVLSPQINWWWYSKHPPQLPDAFLKKLEKASPTYSQLSTAQKQVFRDRVALFNLAADWTPSPAWPEERVPPDVSLALSVQAVTLTIAKKDFLFKKFEKVIVYPKLFLTPEYTFPHASELFEPDGCLMFSAEQVMRAFVEPQSLYNVGLHEYAKVFVLTYPSFDWPLLDQTDTWDKLETMSRMSRAHVESVIAIAGIDPLPVAIHHFFTFPEQFSVEMPDEALRFTEIFFN